MNLYLNSKPKLETINRVNDVFFKYTLGSTERKNWTLNFLNITLDLKEEQQFTDISFADKDLLPQELDEKLSILDILATTNDGTKVNIEVQVCNDKYMADRALYYWSRIFGGQLQKQESYDKLHKVISLIYWTLISSRMRIMKRIKENIINPIISAMITI